MSAKVILLAYGRVAQLVEYLRAGAGLACAAVPPAILSLSPWMMAIFLAAAALFLGHLFRTAMRHMGRIELSDEGLRVIGPFPASVRWPAVRNLSLRYYPRDREGTAGWMRLRVQGDRGRPLSFDSDLGGFETLLNRAVRAAVAAGVVFDETTRSNIAATGLMLSEDAGTEARPNHRKRLFAA